MGRIKDFDETKALESAMRLFWKKGYSATSMKELEQIMGLTITSIYNAFGNKRALFEKALNHYTQNIILPVFLKSLNKTKSAKNALKATLDDVIDLHFNPLNPGGCFIVLSILENEQHDKRSKKMLDALLYLLRDSIIQRIDKDKKEGKLTRKVNSRSVANHMITLRTGMMTLAKAGFPQKELKKLSNDSVETLFNV